MFVSTRIYEGVVHPEEAGRRARNGLVPLLRGQPGFRAYHLVACSDGTIRSMSCFDTEQQSDGSYAVVRDWVVANMQDLTPTPPRILKGEVTQVQAVPQQNGHDAYVTFQSMPGAAPRSRATPVVRERLIPDILAEVGLDGFYSFRDTADESHLVSVAFFRSEADAQRVHARIWRLMQERVPELYPNRPNWVGGKEFDLRPG